MLNIESLGITSDIKLKIYENVTVTDIKRCVERVENYCNRYEYIIGEVQNDYLALHIMREFTRYMNAYNFEWINISHIEFHKRIEDEMILIEKEIMKDYNPEFIIG